MFRNLVFAFLIINLFLVKSLAQDESHTKNNSQYKVNPIKKNKDLDEFSITNDFETNFSYNHMKSQSFFVLGIRNVVKFKILDYLYLGPVLYYSLSSYKPLSLGLSTQFKYNAFKYELDLTYTFMLDRISSLLRDISVYNNVEYCINRYLTLNSGFDLQKFRYNDSSFWVGFVSFGAKTLVYKHKFLNFFVHLYSKIII